jgi:beta-lactamase superfamily II metal-dependent hydrolase
VGRHNTFGHPRADVLKRLAAAHVQTWRTDREGTVTFLLAADGRISATQDGSN